jgi:uncharacterized protein
MSTILKNYIQDQIYTQPKLLESKTTLKNGERIVTRQFYNKVVKYASDFLNDQPEPKIIAISGLRGVGKTTILASLFLDPKLKKFNHKIFVSIDEIVNIFGNNLWEFLASYQELIGIRFENTTDKFLILIDEIHFDSNWQQILKTIFDRYSNVFVVCTGSSALALNATTDLARRMLIENIEPLSFCEFLQITDKSKSGDDILLTEIQTDLKSILFGTTGYQELIQKIEKSNLNLKIFKYYSNIDPDITDKYLRYGTMPNNLVLPRDSIDDFNNQLLDRIIEKDLVEYAQFRHDTTQKIKNLLLLLASNSDNSINSLSKTLGLNSATLNSILDNFEKCGLITKTLPYGNAEKKVVKPSRYYFSSPVFRLARLKYLNGISFFEQYKGLLFEDVVMQTLCRELRSTGIGDIFNDPNSGNVDFVISSIFAKFALEVGYGSKGMEQAHRSIKRFGLDYGIVISNDQYYTWETQKIVRIPIQWFLLI